MRVTTAGAGVALNALTSDAGWAALTSPKPASPTHPRAGTQQATLVGAALPTVAQPIIWGLCTMGSCDFLTSPPAGEHTWATL